MTSNRCGGTWAAKSSSSSQKADGDGLVEWMLTEGRRSPSHYQPDSLSGRVAGLIGQHPRASRRRPSKQHSLAMTCTPVCRASSAPDGSPGPVVRCTPWLSPPRRTSSRARVKPVTVRSTLTTFGMVVQSFVDQGTLPRNVIALAERPSDPITSDDDTAKSWTVAEVEEFRESV